jgi:hypothetical protein
LFSSPLAACMAVEGQHFYRIRIVISFSNIKKQQSFVTELLRYTYPEQFYPPKPHLAINGHFCGMLFVNGKRNFIA